VCDCDCERPSVYEESEQAARKEHRCCECRRIIRRGERYHAAFGVWVSVAERYKWCDGCETLRATYSEATDGDCYCFGQLHEACEDAELLCRANSRARFCDELTTPKGATP
jgi:hypothetical protein